MSKYESIPLKIVKAIKEFDCSNCDMKIEVGDEYYIQKDKFLQSLSKKRFCKHCYEKYGQEIIRMKKIKKHKEQKTLEEIQIMPTLTTSRPRVLVNQENKKVYRVVKSKVAVKKGEVKLRKK